MKRLFPLLIVTCVLLIAACSNDNDGGGGRNNQPTIISITPNQVSRGQVAVEGTIQGTNLGGVLSVTLGDGITVTQITGVSATEIRIRFSVAVNAGPGARTITVTTSAGTVTVTTLLTVQNNRAPIAQFTVTPNTGATNTNFLFDGSNSNDPGGILTAYRWEFGDTTTANGRITTHRFTRAGRYEVTLTVSDRNNSSNRITKVVVVEDGFAPVAQFSVTPQSGDVDTVFQFNASPSRDNDGRIVRIEWRFGDGGTAVGAIVTHRFRSNGTFEVILTVTDNDGLRASSSKDLRVERFNDQKSIAEIQEVLVRFFKRFSKLDKLKPEQIVVDWSESPECPGRDREINIIQRQQELLQRTNADIVGDIPVFIHPNHVLANANVVADFNWVEKNGTRDSGRSIHHFELSFESGGWLICNFSVTNETDDMRVLFE